MGQSQFEDIDLPVPDFSQTTNQKQITPSLHASWAWHRSTSLLRRSLKSLSPNPETCEPGPVIHTRHNKKIGSLWFTWPDHIERLFKTLDRTLNSIQIPIIWPHFESGTKIDDHALFKGSAFPGT
jgi:hypothetical protein